MPDRILLKIRQMQDSIYHPVLMSLSSPSHKKFTEEGDAMDSLSLPSLQHSPSREEFMNAGGETLGYTPGLLQTRIQLQGGVRSMRKKIDGGESVVPKISSLRCGRILNPKDLYFWSLLHLQVDGFSFTSRSLSAFNGLHLACCG